MSLALVQHLDLAEHTAAAVTWSLLDDLEENVNIYKYLPMSTRLPYRFHGIRYQGVLGKSMKGWREEKKTKRMYESISGLKLSPLTAPQ